MPRPASNTAKHNRGLSSAPFIVTSRRSTASSVERITRGVSLVFHVRNTNGFPSLLRRKLSEDIVGQDGAWLHFLPTEPIWHSSPTSVDGGLSMHTGRQLARKSENPEVVWKAPDPYMANPRRPGTRHRLSSLIHLLQPWRFCTHGQQTSSEMRSPKTKCSIQ